MCVQTRYTKKCKWAEKVCSHKKHKQHFNCCKMHPPMRKPFHSSLAQMCGGVKHVKMPEPLLLYTTGASICLASTKQMCWLSTHLLTISSGSFSLTVIFASKAPKSSPIWIKSFTCPTCRELSAWYKTTSFWVTTAPLESFISLLTQQISLGKHRPWASNIASACVVGLFLLTRKLSVLKSVVSDWRSWMCSDNTAAMSDFS